MYLKGKNFRGKNFGGTYFRVFWSFPRNIQIIA